MHLKVGCLSLRLRMIWNMPFRHLILGACKLAPWCVQHNVHCVRGLVRGPAWACLILSKMHQRLQARGERM